MENDEIAPLQPQDGQPVLRHALLQLLPVQLHSLALPERDELLLERLLYHEDANLMKPTKSILVADKHIPPPAAVWEVT